MIKTKKNKGIFQKEMNKIKTKEINKDIKKLKKHNPALW